MRETINLSHLQTIAILVSVRCRSQPCQFLKEFGKNHQQILSAATGVLPRTFFLRCFRFSKSLIFVQYDAALNQIFTITAVINKQIKLQLRQDFYSTYANNNVKQGCSSRSLAKKGHTTSKNHRRTPRNCNKVFTKKKTAFFNHFQSRNKLSTYFLYDKPMHLCHSQK